MENSIIKDTFTKKMFFKLWWPGTLAAFPYAIGDMVDAIVLGNHMGTLGLAVISFCVPIFMLYNIVMFSLGLGGANRFSILMGEGNIDEAKKCFNDVLKTGIATGIIIAILGIIFIDPLIALMGGSSGSDELYQSVKSYMEILLLAAPLFLAHYIIEAYLVNDNRQGIANIGSVVSSIANIPLTLLFVVALNMGAGGAALSTLFSQLIALICYIPAFRNEDSHLHFTDWEINFKNVFEHFKSGFSVNISYLYQIIFLVVINNTLIRNTGEAGVAVFEMTQNVFYIYMFLWEGNAKAVQPLVSTYIGERYMAGINYVKNLGWQSSGAVALLIALIIIISPPTICYIFGYNDAGSLDEAYFALRLYAVSAIVASIYMCYINFYQAVGEEQKAILMNTIRGGIVLLPCVFLFSFIWTENIWLFYPVSEIVSVLVFFLWKSYTKKEELPFDEKRVFVQTIENKAEDMVAIGDALEAFGEKWELKMKQIYFLRMAVEELGVIMLKYGFKDKEKGFIHLTVIAEDDGTATFHMRDTAGRFNPFSQETSRISEDENFDMDLMGIMVLKKKAKDFSYRNYQGFNTMTMRF